MFTVRYVHGPSRHCFIISALAAFTIEVGSRFVWGYHPNSAVVDFVAHHFIIFSRLFALIAISALVIFTSRKLFKLKSNKPQFVLEICFGLLLISTIAADSYNTDIFSTVKIGEQEFVLSTALDPRLNTSMGSPVALFEYEGDRPIDVVYITPENQYGFLGTPNRNFKISIHAPNSPDIECKPDYISICLDEKAYVLKLYPENGYLGYKDALERASLKESFKLFIDENLEAIRKDVDALKVITVPSP